MTASPILIIRDRRADDLAVLSRTLVAVHGHDGYPVEGVADPLAWLEPPGMIRAWVAELEGHVVGQVILTEPPVDDPAVALWATHAPDQGHHTATLCRLFVHPAARGRAIGSQLTKTATDHAAERGLTVLLDVMVKDAAAIRTYERLGWRRLGSVTHRFGDDRTEAALAFVAPAAT